MSFKKPKLTLGGVLTGIGEGAPTPTAQLKNGTSSLTPEVKTPEPTEAQKALEASQREQIANLDAQENERRKRLLSAMQGVRGFRGSALFRANTAAQNAANLPTSNSGVPGSLAGRIVSGGGTRATIQPVTQGARSV